MNHIALREAIFLNEFYLLDISMCYRLSKSLHLKSDSNWLWSKT